MHINQKSASKTANLGTSIQNTAQTAGTVGLHNESIRTQYCTKFNAAKAAALTQRKKQQTVYTAAPTASSDSAAATENRLVMPSSKTSHSRNGLFHT